ncbi:MAG TPA: UbiA family prenyltransferase, partial [Lacunisphaera sp.]|nr:UbiA family prenyltransferase [Lacunisphaera sp.]
MSSFRSWLEASRPKTLPAAVIPVLVGTALAQAHDSANLTSAVICLGFSLLVQIGTNFANDYFDFVQGADTPARVGPRRAVAAGLISPPAMLTATWVVLGAAFAVGLLLVREGGWVLLPIGIVSIACAIA